VTQRSERPGPEAGIHPTAIIEPGVSIGRGTRVWDHVHIREPTTIGEECIIGEKTYIAYGVCVGDRVKLNAFVYVCTAVTLEDGVMIGAGTIFTNDRFPRATTPDLRRLRDSGPDESTLPTRVRAGASVGAGCVVGCGLTIGRFAMLGMGSVVTDDVADFHLALGSPARSVGCVCRCGRVLARFDSDRPGIQELRCASCGLPYRIRGREVSETDPPGAAG
jgi:acetyltransferase-like isoleucine patch superfamily enzyme